MRKFIWLVAANFLMSGNAFTDSWKNLTSDGRIVSTWPGRHKTNRKTEPQCNYGVVTSPQPQPQPQFGNNVGYSSGVQGTFPSKTADPETDKLQKEFRAAEPIIDLDQIKVLTGINLLCVNHPTQPGVTAALTGYPAPKQYWAQLTFINDGWVWDQVYNSGGAWVPQTPVRIYPQWGLASTYYQADGHQVVSVRRLGKDGAVIYEQTDLNQGDNRGWGSITTASRNAFAYGKCYVPK